MAGTLWRSCRVERVELMADLYSLMHREAGPLATSTTPAEAEAELEAVLED